MYHLTLSVKFNQTQHTGGQNKTILEILINL